MNDHTTPETMTQVAPYPRELASIVDRLSYRDGWTFRLADTDRGQGSRGLTLVITTRVPDSYHPGHTILVAHYMLVPPAAYNERSWKWWLFDQIGLVERHERAEFFRIDGQPVTPPAHGPGNDPYLLLDYGTDLDRRTQATGAVNPE
jgi:hypothetical protein